MQEKNYITPQGFERLNTEQGYLARVERPEVVKTVQWAASLGDRSENADYQYGKRRLREIDRRLRFLSKRIKAAEVVAPEKIRSECVQFGATVELENERGELKIYAIVGSDEIDTSLGLISWKSPIGRALLGKQVGDEVEIRTPQSLLLAEILCIEYKVIHMTDWSPPRQENYIGQRDIKQE